MNKSIVNFKELNQEKLLLDLYHEHFPKVRNTIIKFFYYKNLQYIMDIDDLTAILDQAFICAYKSYQKLNHQFPFEKHFYIIAKGKVIDAYRAYNSNKKKILKLAFHENETESFLADLYHQCNNIDDDENDWVQANKSLQMKFIRWFYRSIKGNNLNKKILYYKFKYYNLTEIANILNISKRIISKHWSYLINRMRVQYQYWLKVNKKYID